MYSEYCCNNPISVATVRSLMQSPEYAEFFEACRRLQLMDKLPLHGFLLRPIQRICQYHLQLTELMKQTEESHQDYSSVVEAVETMKAVAMKINDTQRQFDSLQEIIRMQNSIEGWEVKES
jgi:Rho guanine nucleotide exchange factor 4